MAATSLSSPAQYGGVQFKQAIEFFRGKLNLPTQAWDDIWGAMHSRAFVVAGAQKAALLSDLRSAMDKAIADGMSLNEFKTGFKNIVARHGWDHRGNADWRARIIYDTNMRQSYNAGRWQQLQAFPYWQYQHGHPSTPREDHLRWHGTVLPRESPWWQSHFPQNGWGCTCFVRGLTEGQFKRRGLVVSQEPGQASYEWLNPKTGELLKVPKGIDPGFDYSPGEAAFGKRLTDQAMAQWRAIKQDAWDNLTPGGWQSNGRPQHLPLHPPQVELAKRVATRRELQQLLVTTLGSEEQIWQSGPLSVYVNAASLAEHIDIARAPFVPLLPGLLSEPDEIWASFERHKGTGKVELRFRLIRLVGGGKYKGQLMVAQAVRGLLEAWTFIPVKQLNYLNGQRQGILVYAGKE